MCYHVPDPGQCMLLHCTTLLVLTTVSSASLHHATLYNLSSNIFSSRPFTITRNCSVSSIPSCNRASLCTSPIYTTQNKPTLYCSTSTLHHTLPLYFYSRSFAITDHRAVLRRTRPRTVCVSLQLCVILCCTMV